MPPSTFTEIGSCAFALTWRFVYTQFLVIGKEKEYYSGYCWLCAGYKD